MTGLVIRSSLANRNATLSQSQRSRENLPLVRGCMLSRVRTGMSPDEMTCTIPSERLGEVVEKLKLRREANAAVAAYANEDLRRFALIALNGNSNTLGGFNETFPCCIIEWDAPLSIVAVGYVRSAHRESKFHQNRGRLERL